MRQPEAHQAAAGKEPRLIRDRWREPGPLLTPVTPWATMFLVNAFVRNMRPATPAPLTPIEFEILLSLAAGDQHGYAIKQDIEARAGGDLVMRPGTLYRAISRLLDAGLIGEVDQAPDQERSDERRRYYTLTAHGHEAARGEARRLARQVHAARARKLLPRQA